MQYSCKRKTPFQENGCIMPTDLLSLAMQQDLTEKLPKKISEIRKRQELTQVQVAEKLGTSQGNYALYETGARGISLKLLPRLAEALDVNVEELLGLEAKQAKKRGPASQLEKRFERIRSLPPKDRKFISEAIDRMLGQAKAS